MRLPTTAVASRRAATFIAAALVSRIGIGSSSAALEVQQRSESEVLANKLYGTPPPTVVPYQQQVNDAITIQSMRGMWQLEERLKGSDAVGELFFRGAEQEERGSVSYVGQAGSGRGPWIIKADGFGRSPRGVGGAIERKALWKLRRGSAGTFTYAGRVNVVGYFADGMPDATVDGDIIELVNGGKPKGGSERKVGTFHATLRRRLRASEEEASTDSAAAGGAPETLNVNTLMPDALVYKAGSSSP